MALGPSVGELVQAWIAHHWAVDALLQVALGTALVLVSLMALAGSVYWCWYVCRLLRHENRTRFIQSPIPALRRAKVAGGEVELTSGLREGLPEFEAGIMDALGGLAARVGVLEKSLEGVETKIGGMGEVGGRLPPVGGSDE